MSISNCIDDSTRYWKVDKQRSLINSLCLFVFFRANIQTLGFRTAPIMASRGAKEGNNALMKVNNIDFNS